MMRVDKTYQTKEQRFSVMSISFILHFMFYS